MGGGGGDRRKENAGYWQNHCVTCTYTQTHKKCICADYTTNKAERHCNSQGLTMTSQDRPRDRGMKRRWADIFPLGEAVHSAAGYTSPFIAMIRPSKVRARRPARAFQ